MIRYWSDSPLADAVANHSVSYGAVHAGITLKAGTAKCLAVDKEELASAWLTKPSDVEKMLLSMLRSFRSGGKHQI